MKNDKSAKSHLVGAEIVLIEMFSIKKPWIR